MTTSLKSAAPWKHGSHCFWRLWANGRQLRRTGAVDALSGWPAQRAPLGQARPGAPLPRRSIFCDAAARARLAPAHPPRRGGARRWRDVRLAGTGSLSRPAVEAPDKDEAERDEPGVEDHIRSERRPDEKALTRHRREQIHPVGG